MAEAIADETISNSGESISVAPLAQEMTQEEVNKNSSMLAKNRRTVGDFLGLSKEMCSSNDAKIYLNDILNLDISGEFLQQCFPSFLFVTPPLMCLKLSLFIKSECDKMII